MDEKGIWKGSPSHLLNFGVYALWLIVFAAIIVAWVLVGDSIKGAGPILFYLALVASVVPLLVILVKAWQLKARRFVLTSERLTSSQGILNKKTNALELYRVKDYVLTEPFFYRLFGCGHIEVITSDPTSPRMQIPAVRHPRQLLDEIRQNVEQCRERKGVRQLDVDQLDEPHPGSLSS